MKIECVKNILEKISKVKIAVLGDYCLDAYWTLDMQKSEISLETDLATEPVSQQKYSLGGAGNIVANLSALKTKRIQAIGVIGDDLFGFELQKQLKELNVDTEFLIKQKEKFNTYTYSKRYVGDQEQPRIDFGCFNQRTKQTDDLLFKGFEKALAENDAIIFNQQVSNSIPNDSFFVRIEELLVQNPNKTFIFDSRHYGEKLNNVSRKTNAIEAANLVGKNCSHDSIVEKEKLVRIGQQLFQKSQKPIFITRGDRGVLVFDLTGSTEINGIQFLKQLDIVGAGDTFISAIASCLAAGISPKESAAFANFAASVTVQKLFTTGVAYPNDILKVAEDPDYIFNPELAEDSKNAKYYKNTTIEIITQTDEIKLGNIKHAFFDHDGTISTLRIGWQEVMEKVMIQCILGDHLETIEKSIFDKVKNRVQDYIDKSTGIQTILQMEALIEMVKESGFVLENKILDKFGYKKIYNDALMKNIQSRIDQLSSGKIEPENFIIKNAVDFLKALKERGVTLYLASGTDLKDVKSEAQILGYGDLFDGGIFGAVGDIKKYSKKLLIKKVMEEKKLQGNELVFFGDGPVEMRECRKKGGIAVGVASDESKREGLNPKKREKLIKAGAHFLVPDFSDYGKILKLFFKEA